MSLIRPRTIRGQLIAGLVLLEGLLVVVFCGLTIRTHMLDARQRSDRRFEYQVSAFASQAAYALADNRLDRLKRTLVVMQESPTILAAQFTDLNGRTVANSDPGKNGKFNLSPAELAVMKKLNTFTIFSGAPGEREAAGPVYIDNRLVGYVWIYPDNVRDQKELTSLLLLTMLYTLGAAVVCALLAMLLARSITRPLKLILVATRRLVQHPEDTSSFPITLAAPSEAADLATGLNLMVASIENQRAGLNDALGLLDSMLANAPIGFAFFDRKYKLVRINQFLADLNQRSISLHLGRTVDEILPPEIAEPMQRSIEAVFETGEPVRDLELVVDLSDPLAIGLRGSAASTGQHKRCWLANLYPVKTGSQAVRWVGVIIVDTTERKNSEDALRKTEKLAATGRLAASIAHEINNPLEAVTNLLYLLRHHTALDAQALAYTEQAQHEVARVSEITQQTLRFYRQSTVPLLSSIGDLLDSVVTLHQGRVNALQVEVVREYRGGIELFCFAGEIRQLFANLVGNALDAMSQGGGRLTLAVRPSRSWRDSSVRGVRVIVADTGSGMEEQVRRRIFEPFFTTKEVTGTGLGLWVSAEIIEKHSGTVRVRSRTIGSHRGPDGSHGPHPGATGTVFMVFFPEDGHGVKTEAELVQQA